MEELLPVLPITLSAVLQYCKSQVIINFITICEPQCISNEIRVVEILVIKVTMALPFTSRLMTLAMQWWQRNRPKSLLHVQSFCFAYFLISMVIVVALSLLVALLCNTILGMGWFCLKNRWKVQQNWHRSYEYMKIIYVNYGVKN